MEETLTTENVDSQVEENVQAEENSQVEETTTETSYDDAWDKLDLDNVDEVSKVLEEGIQNEQPEDTANESEETEEEAAKRAFMEAAPVLKFKGKDVPVDSPDELVNLAQKGFKLETEMSKIKPMKRKLSMVEEVPEEVLQAIADLQAGKQEAIDYIREFYGVETEKDPDDFFSYDNDEPKKESSTYKPEIKQENPIEEFWNEFAKEHTKEAAVVSETYKELDPSFQAELYTPDLFPAFVESVRTGEFDKVYPIAVKERMLNPALSWIDAYGTAVQKVGIQEPEKTEPPASAQIPSNKTSNRQVSKTSADEIWENDEAFKQMQQEIFTQG